MSEGRPAVPLGSLEDVSEENSQRLDRRGSEAASFTREGAVIRDGNRNYVARAVRWLRRH